MATLTARDLDALVDPTMYVGETEAATRLVRRYFTGGAVLLGWRLGRVIRGRAGACECEGGRCQQLNQLMS